jgi:hypothetical protein
VQRPLVRVREEIGEDAMPPPYWRFHEQYGGQTGVGGNSDLPNDIKFQYAGVVLRGAALDKPRYAIYGSLFVLVPDDDPGGGTRTFPPFRAVPESGPIMRLKGRDIDLFLHLTGVRPGSVLEVGDTFALAGAVGPPLPASVRYTVTRPDGSQVRFSGRANAVGYYYRQAHDFVVDQPGVYTVDVTVTFRGETSAGPVDPAQPPRGDVLGTANGKFRVFVVEPGSTPLKIDLPAHTFLAPPAGFEVTATAPTGMRVKRAFVTTMMPGFILENRVVNASRRRFDYHYDPVALARDFPNLDVEQFGRAEAADIITVTLFASGEDTEGNPMHAARVVALHGIELFSAIAAPRAKAEAAHEE